MYPEIDLIARYDLTNFFVKISELPKKVALKIEFMSYFTVKCWVGFCLRKLFMS